MDTPNLFMEDTDFNICKSWLCDSTDGATYSINDHFEGKMKCPANMTQEQFFQTTVDFFEWEGWNETIGYRHNYKIDDPEVDKIATKMVKDLTALIDRLNEDPDYLNWDRQKFVCMRGDTLAFVFEFHGSRKEACRYAAELVIAELGDGDGENNGKGILKNCKDEIAAILERGQAYRYANCLFEFRKY